MTKQRIFATIGLILMSIWIIHVYVNEYFPSDPEKIVDLITKQTAISLRKNQDLYLIGTGGSMLDNDIRMLHMGFNYFHEVNVENGRILLIAAIQEYLFKINANNNVRPYLNIYPFTVKNIEIQIFIRTSNGGTVPSEQINYIGARNGILEYQRNEPHHFPSITVCEETYEEALQHMQ